MIQLEKFETSDFERFINWIDSEKLMYIFAAKEFEYPVTKNQLEIYNKVLNRIAYKVIHKKTKEIIGHAELNNIDQNNKSARICRVLIGNKKYRNKGFGSKIINELVRIGFHEMDLHRIDLGVYDFNKNAIKCYQNCGFEIEGLFKENIKIDSEYWSVYNMSILNNNENSKIIR
tara:strand:+ start:789 stop:1310 length:522 start_codon:yes stop_codon:yes gene_type:complete